MAEVARSNPGRDDDGGRRRKVREKDEVGLGVKQVTHSVTRVLSAYAVPLREPAHVPGG